MTWTPGSRVTMVRSGPDHLFQIGDITRTPDRELTATMPVGPTILAGGQPQVAGLGVLADDVLGYAVSDQSGGWAVSTELSLDMTGSIPQEGRLTACARVVHADAMGALATGEVLANGHVIARCSLRGRFRTTVPMASETGSGAPFRSGDVDRRSIDTVLGTEERSDTGTIRLRVDDRHVNPMDNLHGGIHFSLVERSAALAVPDLPDTASVRLQLVRGLALGEAATLTAQVLHRGRSLAVVLVRTHDGHGRLVNVGTVVRHPAPVAR